MNVANQSDTVGPLAGVPYDGDNPEYDDFYLAKHDDLSSAGPEYPPEAWMELWSKRMKDLIDNYHPDHFYFDGAIPFRGDMGKTGMDVIAHLVQPFHGNARWKAGGRDVYQGTPIYRLLRP